MERTNKLNLSPSSKKTSSNNDDDNDDEINDKSKIEQNINIPTRHWRKMLLCQGMDEIHSEAINNDIKILDESNNGRSLASEKTTTTTTTTTNTNTPSSSQYSDEVENYSNNNNNNASTKRGMKRKYGVDDCEIVANKTYQIETEKNTMDFPGTGYFPLPSEIEVNDITSSNDESSARKINNKKTMVEQQSLDESESQPAMQDTSKIENPSNLSPPTSKTTTTTAKNNYNPCIYTGAIPMQPIDLSISRVRINNNNNEPSGSGYLGRQQLQQIQQPLEHSLLQSNLKLQQQEPSTENRPSTSTAKGVTHPVMNNINTANTKVPELFTNEMNRSVDGTLQMQWGNNDSAAINNRETSNLSPPTTSTAAPVLKLHKISTTTSKTTTTTATKNNYNPHIYTGTIPKQPVGPSTSGVRINNNNNEPSGSDYLGRQRQQLQQIKQQQQVKQQQIQQEVQKPLEHKLLQSNLKLQQQEPQQPPRTRDVLQQNLIQHQKNLLLHDALDDNIDKNYSKVKKTNFKDEVDYVLTAEDCYQQLIELFPIAEPGYMRVIAATYHRHKNHLKSYIEANISQPSYPIKEQYLAKLKTTKQQLNIEKDQFDTANTLLKSPTTTTVEKTKVCNKNFKTIGRNYNCKAKTPAATTTTTATAARSLTPAAEAALDRDAQQVFRSVELYTQESVKNGLYHLGKKRGGFLYEMRLLESKNSDDNSKKKTDDDPTIEKEEKSPQLTNKSNDLFYYNTDENGKKIIFKMSLNDQDGEQKKKQEIDTLKADESILTFRFSKKSEEEEEKEKKKKTNEDDLFKNK